MGQPATSHCFVCPFMTNPLGSHPYSSILVPLHKMMHPPPPLHTLPTHTLSRNTAVVLSLLEARGCPPPPRSNFPLAQNKPYTLQRLLRELIPVRTWWTALLNGIRRRLHPRWRSTRHARTRLCSLCAYCAQLWL